MDKISHYQTLIREFFTAYEAFLTAPPKSELETVVVLDDDRCQYILFKAGWQGSAYHRYFTLHVTIRNGKIWIKEDMTEEEYCHVFSGAGCPPRGYCLRISAA